MFKDRLEGVTSINGDNSYGEYSMETIAALEPDLILTYSDADYDSLSKIVPTIYINYLELTTEERITLIASALNRKSQGEALLSDFDALVEHCKQQLDDAGILDKTITLMETYQKSLYVYGDHHGPGRE